MTEPKSSRVKLAHIAPLPVPFVLFIDPCGRCNLRCRFCPTNNSDYLVNERHSMMSLGLFKKLIDDLQHFSEPVKVLNLYGFGEPLLNTDIAEMVRLLKQSGTCHEVRLTTNGVLLTPELSESLIESGLDMLRVSVNGTNDTDYADICGVPVSTALIQDNVAAAYSYSRSTPTKISTKFITASANAGEGIELFIKMYSGISDYCYVEDEEEHWGEFSGAEASKHLSGRVYTGKSKICSYPLTHMTVFSNGRVGICCNDWKMDTLIGDANNESLPNIWNNRRMREFRLNMLSGRRGSMPSCCDCKVMSPDNIESDEAEVIIKKYGCEPSQ